MCYIQNRNDLPLLSNLNLSNLKFLIFPGRTRKAFWRGKRIKGFSSYLRALQKIFIKIFSKIPGDFEWKIAVTDLNLNFFPASRKQMFCQLLWFEEYGSTTGASSKYSWTSISLLMYLSLPIKHAIMLFVLDLIIILQLDLFLTVHFNSLFFEKKCLKILFSEKNLGFFFFIR